MIVHSCAVKEPKGSADKTLIEDGMNTYTPPRARQPEGESIPINNQLAKLNSAGARRQIRTGRLAPPLPPMEACSGRPIACHKIAPPHVLANS